MLMAAELELLVAAPPTGGPEAEAMTELVEQGLQRRNVGTVMQRSASKVFPYNYMQIFKASSTMCYEI